MRNPDIRVGGLTPFEARVLCNATTEPRAASALNDGVTAGGREHTLDALVAAGFLLRRRVSAKRIGYVITPAGAEFAAYLERLDAAREAQ